MSAAELTPVLTGKLEQRQQLSPVQRHSLEILALPLAALETKLAQEFAVNPVLEEVPPESAGDLPEEGRPGDAEDENDYERNAACADEWADELPLPGSAPSGGAERDDAAADPLGNSPAPPPSLKTMLLAELNCANCPEKLFPPAVEIISALNDDGLVASNLADIAMASDADMDDVLAALRLVQNIAPAGVAARDVSESLKLQLERRGQLTPVLAKLLTEGREDLEKNRLPALCAKLDVSPAELEEMLKLLRTLDPAPGRERRPEVAAVLPDIEIVRTEDGGYRTVVRREFRSRVAVSPLYEKLLERPDLSGEDRAYLTEKINRAREFVQAMTLRESTLKRIGDVIIAEQRDFLDRGVRELKPMTMKQTAAQLDLSESTVSRAVAEKFAATPQGMFPLRFFFSGGYHSENGSEVAAQAVKEQIRRAIAAEDPAAPLSDDALAGLLKRSGLSVARRTVAKYRESMRIPASSLRRKHF
ncbi:MAG: RNA polymerase factor sigma-54 [Lentisphaeria bacterium]|nr:RNA polymerase factor sigma-54 [Lentisphaeria bacterium]